MSYHPLLVDNTGGKKLQVKMALIMDSTGRMQLLMQ